MNSKEVATYIVDDLLERHPKEAWKHYIERAINEMSAVPTFPRPSQNQTVSSGVEGAHEGTTADKTGLAESSLSSPPPEKEK